MNQEEFENQKSIEDSSEEVKDRVKSELPNLEQDSTSKSKAEDLKSEKNSSTEENPFPINLQLQQPQDKTSVLESGSHSQKLVNNVSPMSVDSEQSTIIDELQRQEKALRTEIANLQVTQKILSQQVQETQTKMGQVVQEALGELERRKQTLQIAVEQLEKRQERTRKEMRTTFAGASQDLAIRVQGFKDYLTGSLQDLAAAAEQLELAPIKPREKPEIVQSRPRVVEEEPESDTPQFTQQRFQDTTKKIRALIDQYRTKPDYYGPPWQLRRTFEPVHAERASKWFFEQGGRGALRTLGSRLQNTLVTSAVISILHRLYGDRVRALILANSPERLGEWRRGLQDCLGIGRPDFGPDRGVALFETPEAIAQKAERLVKARLMPLIIIDDSEEEISLGLLEFPLWLAFAPDPKMMRNSYYDDDF